MLIVDDEMDMRILVRVVLDLAGKGFTVVGEASDGDEALERWRSLRPPPTPDVVVLDNRMPNRTGLETAVDILRELPGQAIVLYSAFLDDEVKRQAAEIGISACVSKDDLDSLPEVIEQVLATP